MYKSPSARIYKKCECGNRVTLFLEFGTRDYYGTCQCGVRWQREGGLTQRAADEAICTTQYHIMLASKGDSFCGVCHIPLHR